MGLLLKSELIMRYVVIVKIAFGLVDVPTEAAISKQWFRSVAHYRRDEEVE
jgi:hypothetical protein